MLLLPLAPFIFTGISTGFAWLWSKYVRRRTVLNVRLAFMCQNSEQVWAHFLSWLASSLPFLNITYNGLCWRAFTTFGCMVLRDGTTLVLKAAPEVLCWESDEHRAMVGIAIVAIIFYVIGIPLGFFLGLRRARAQDKLRDETFLEICGYLYMKYGPTPTLPLPFLPKVGVRILGESLPALCFRPCWRPFPFCLVQIHRTTSGSWLPSHDGASSRSAGPSFKGLRMPKGYAFAILSRGFLRSGMAWCHAASQGAAGSGLCGEQRSEHFL